MEQLRKLTLLGWLGIIVLLNGVIIGGTSQLTELVGAFATGKLVAFAALGNMFLGGVITMFSGQATQTQNVIADPHSQEALIRAVLAMPGVEKVDVNSKASATLATVAVDPSVNKISPTPAAQAAVEATAARAIDAKAAAA